MEEQKKQIEEQITQVNTVLGLLENKDFNMQLKRIEQEIYEK